MNKPLIHGKGGLFGGSASSSKASTPVQGKDNLRSKATARLIDVISEGPIFGLVAGKQSVLLNKVAMQESNGLENFTNMRVYFRYGTPTQEPVPNFSEVENQFSVGITPRTRTNAVGSVQIFNGGSGYTTATVKFIGGLGTPGTVGGTGPNANDPLIPTAAAEGTVVITNGRITAINITKPGSNYFQSPTIQITGDGTGFSGYAHMNGGAIYTVTDNDVDAVRITGRVNQFYNSDDKGNIGDAGVVVLLEYRDDQNPLWRLAYDDSKYLTTPGNSPETTSIKMTVSVKVPPGGSYSIRMLTRNITANGAAFAYDTVTGYNDSNVEKTFYETSVAYDLAPGSYTYVATDDRGNPVTVEQRYYFDYKNNFVRIAGKTTSGYEEAWRINLPTGRGKRQVRMWRAFEDSTTTLLQNEIVFQYCTEILSSNMMYMDTAIAAIEADAEFFGGQVPARAYDVYGRIVRVPSNYDPLTRSYTAFWNGTFKQAYTNNPVWCFLDLLTHERYGLGQWIKDRHIDMGALYIMSKYCDELVDNKRGGTGPRFTLNTQIMNQEEAYSVLGMLASVFRGMIYWSSGTVFATQDSPGPVKRLASPSKVINGDFSYVGVGKDAQHSVARVSYNDPSNFYEKAYCYYEDPDRIAKYGYEIIDLVAYGCTDEAMALRMGKWLIDSEKFANKVVSFRSGWDWADAVPGEIIAVADPTRAGVRQGGRVQTAATTTLTFDAPYVFEANQTYTLTVAVPTWGRCRLVPGATTIQGNRTLFNNNYNPLKVDDIIIFDKDATQYRITAVDSNTQIKITPAYTGGKTGNAHFTVMRGNTLVMSSFIDLLDVPINHPGAGARTTVTFTKALPFVPNPESNWIIAASNVVPAQFRIQSVKEVSRGQFEVVALEHDPNKYLRVEQDVPILPPVIFVPPKQSAQMPRNASAKEGLFLKNGLVRNRINLFWEDGSPLAPSTGYYVMADTPDRGSVNLGFTPNQNIDLDEAAPGPYTFYITALGINGDTSAPLVHNFTALSWDGAVGPTVRNLGVVGGYGTGNQSFKTRAPTWAWESTLPANIPPYPIQHILQVINADTDVVLRVIPNYGQTSYTYEYETNYADTGGNPVRKLRLRVSALDAVGRISSTLSSIANNPTPDAIDFSVVPGLKTLAIQMTRPDDPDFQGYYVWVSKVNNFNPRTVAPVYKGGSDIYFHNVTDEDLYYVRVAAYDSFSDAIAGLTISPQKSVRASIQALDPTAPTVPGKPALTTASEVSEVDGTVTARVSATWTASTGNFADLYEVAVSEEGGSFIVERVNGNQWVRHGFRPNIEVTVKVLAVSENNYAKSAYSTPATITTPKNTAVPLNPTGATVESGWERAFLKWTASTTVDVSHVEVWAFVGSSTAAVPPTGSVLLARVAGRTTSYQDPSLQTTATKTYWLRAVNTSGVVAGAYVRAGTATSEQIKSAQIGAGIVDRTKIATNLEVFEIVSALPTTGLTDGRQVYFNGKNYRYNLSKSKWDTTTEAGDIEGQISDTQIAGLNASKLAGTIPSSVIANIRGLTSTHISSLSAEKINGAAGSLDGQLIDKLSSAQIVNAAGTALFANDKLKTTSLDGFIQEANFQTGSIAASKLTLTDLTNIVPNGSFEGASLDRWNTPVGLVTVPNSSDLIPPGAPTQNTAYLPAPANGTSVFIGCTGDIPVTPGESYHFSAAYAALAGNTVIARLGFQLFNANKTPIPTATLLVAQVNDTWTTYGANYTVPAGVAYLRPIVWVIGTSADRVGGIGFTKVRLRKSANAELIVDGAIVARHLTANLITAKHLVLTDTQNIIINGDFSQGLDGWDRIVGAVAFCSPDASTPSLPAGSGFANGVRLIRVANNENSLTWGAPSFDSTLGVTVQPGDEFLLECWAYSTVAGLAPNDIVVRGTDSGGLTVPALARGPNLVANTWTRCVQTVQADVAGKLFVRLRNQVADSTLYLAGVRFLRRNAATLVVDGSIVGRHVATNSISAKHVTLSDYQNLLANGDFAAGIDADWVKIVAAGVGSYTNLVASTDPAAGCLTIAANAANIPFDGGFGTPCRVGEQFYYEGWVRTSVATTTGYVQLVLNRATDGVLVGAGSRTLQTAANTWLKFSGVFTATVTGNAKLRIATGTANTQFQFTALRLQRMNGAELTVDGSLTARKLMVGGTFASNMLNGGEFVDRLDSWTGSETATAFTVFDTGGPTGTPYLRMSRTQAGPTPSSRADIASLDYIPVEGSTVYELVAYLRGSSASPLGAYLRLTWYDANKAVTTDAGTGAVTNANGISDTYSNGALTTTWTKRGGNCTSPPSARYVRVTLIHFTTSTTQHMDVASVTLKRAMAGTMIEDGSIITQHVQTAAITASKMVLQDITNLLLNGDFTQGVSEDWNVSNASLVTLSRALPAGAPAATGVKLDRTNSSTFISQGQDITYNSGAPVASEEQFYFECWAYSTVAGNTQFALYGRTVGGAVNGHVLTAPVPANTWVKLSINFTMPAFSDARREQLRLFNNIDNSTIYYTNCRLLRRNAASLVVDGGIVANHLETQAVTTRALAAYAVTSSRMSILSNNMLFNSNGQQSDANNNMRGVAFTNNNTELGGNVFGGRTDNTYPGVAPFLVRMTSNPAADTFTDVELRRPDASGNPTLRYPVTVGSRYELSAYIAAYSSTGTLYADWHNSAGAIISRAYTSLPSPTGGVLSRIGGFTNAAPAGAAFISFNCRTTWSGGSGAQLFLSAPMLGAVPAETAANMELSAYVDGGVTSIDGSSIYTGSLKANQIEADSFIAATSVITVLSASILKAGVINTDMLGVGLSTGNLIANSDVLAGINNYRLTANQWPSGTTMLRTDWTPPGMNGVTAYTTNNTVSAGQFADICYFPVSSDGTYSFYIPVVGGQRYEVQVASFNLRCSSRLFVVLYDANKAGLSGGTIAAPDTLPANTSVLTNQPLTAYNQNRMFVDLPTNCAYIRVFVRGTYTGTGPAGNGCFLTTFGWYLAKAQPNQKEYSAYAPSSVTVIDGGYLATDTVTGRVIKAGEILTGHMKAGTIDVKTVAVEGSITTVLLDADVLTAKNITLSGSTKLTSWQQGGDLTRINGGAISANTVRANSLQIGSRGLIVTGIEFSMGRNAAGAVNNLLSWTAGSISYTNDTGGTTTQPIDEGSRATGGNPWYVFFKLGQSALISVDTSGLSAQNNAGDTVCLCAVSSSTGIQAIYGGTQIDGTRITTGSISALQMAAYSINAELFSGGTITTTNGIYLGNARFLLQASTRLLRIFDDGGIERVSLGDLSPWAGSGAYGLILRDGSGNEIINSGGVVGSRVTGQIPASAVPGLPGSIITSGAIPASAVPAHSAGLLTSGTIPTARVSGLAAGNLSATAGIAGSQLSGTANIAGSQLSGTANIAGSQLSGTAGIIGTQLSANAGITSAQQASGIGINTVPNSDIELNTAYWTPFNSNTGVNCTLAVDGWDRRVAGGHCMSVTMQAGGTLNTNNVWDCVNTGVNGTGIVVRPSARYELSTYIGTASCGAVLYIFWYNASGGYISEAAVGGAVGDMGFGGATSLGQYGRLAGFVNSPSNAAFAKVGVRANGIGTQTSAFFWITRFYFGEAGINQTEVSPWIPVSVPQQITASNVGTYIANLAVGTAQMALLSVTNALIANGAILNAKIGNLEVDSAKIANLTVGNGKITNGAVTNSSAITGANNAKTVSVSINVRVANTNVFIIAQRSGDPETNYALGTNMGNFGLNVTPPGGSNTSIRTLINNYMTFTTDGKTFFLRPLPSIILALYTAPAVGTYQFTVADSSASNSGLTTIMAMELSK